MLYYERIDVSEEIDVNKTNGLCECINCHYCYFPEIILDFSQKTCLGCHILMQKAVSFNDVAMVYVKGNNYRFFFSV